MRGVVTASPARRLSSPRLDLDRRTSKSLASSSSSSPSPSSTSLLPLPLRPRPRNLSPLRSPRPPRTSEFWYEDEEEFDAIAGSLRRKTVYVFGGGNGNGGEEEEEATTTARAAAEQLAGVPFDACFYGQPGDEEAGPKSCGPALSVLWPAGRSGPPYFLRPRRRPALDELTRRVSSPSSSAAAEVTAAAAAAAADAAWAEISSQNWRVELAYGLGGTKATAAAAAAAEAAAAGGGSSGGGAEEPLLDPERPEAVLVVVAPASAARALAAAAAAAAASAAAASASSTTDQQQLYSVVTLREWEGGIDSVDATAPGWRELLEEK